MSGAIAPFVPFSPDDHGAVVIVYSVTACCFSVVFIVARLVVATKRTLELKTDDSLILVALAIAITQTVLLAKAQRAGLGRHFSSLSPDEITSFYKLTYSGQILTVIAMTLSKASVIFLFKRLNIYRARLPPLLILLAIIAAWCIMSVFIMAFECHLPEPWRITPSNCPSNGKLYYVVGSLNFVTDAILSLYIIPGIWNLHMSKDLRVTVIALFASRLLVCVASILDLAWLSQYLDPADLTWDTVRLAILGNIIMHLSLITATVPRIHSVIATLQTGQLGFQVPNQALRRRQDRLSRPRPPKSEGSSHPSSESGGRRWENSLKLFSLQRIFCIARRYSKRRGSNGSNPGTPPREQV